ncbi:MAG: hypothetical protein H6654_03585 [Ardenticatenaceae bacterium]|nr:hypothetical protein [Ardenticatenaceae bacterium]
MQANIANIRQRWAKAKLTKMAAFWVAIGAIILTLFFGFSRGGWMTGGSAERMAESASQSAVVERLAPICVMQFNQDPSRDQKLEELKTLGSDFQRAKYVKEQGWATIPGEETPDGPVATECAKRLMQLNE